LPLLVKTVFWAASAGTTPVDKQVQTGTEIIVEAATPWWVNPVVWLSGLGTIGAIVIVVLLIFAAKNKLL
jgi:hypothetical protein